MLRIFIGLVAEVAVASPLWFAYITTDNRESINFIILWAALLYLKNLIRLAVREN